MKKLNSKDYAGIRTLFLCDECRGCFDAIMKLDNEKSEAVYICKDCLVKAVEAMSHE